MIPAATMAWGILRELRRMDELQLRIQLEALGFSFAGTAILTFSYGFLEGLGYPRLSMFTVWPILATPWIVGLVLARRRYRRETACANCAPSGWSQAGLGERLGVSRQTVNAIENERYPTPACRSPSSSPRLSPCRSKNSSSRTDDMTISLSPLLRLAAARAQRAFCTVSMRFAVIVAIVVALTTSAHAAVPFEVRVTGTGPDVLLIPGLASSGAVWDDTVKQLCTRHRCHVSTLAGGPAQSGPLLDNVDAALATYIEQHHLQAPIVIGHSLGNFVALRLAIGHPAE